MSKGVNMISKRFANDGKASLNLSDLQKKYIANYQERCMSGKYKFRNRICECGNEDFEILAQKDRYGISMDTVICKRCGLIMTNPCLEDDSNNEFYDNEYPYIYRAEDKPSEEVFLKAKEDGFGIVSFIERHTGIKSGRVLEIGCADGRNVAAFSERGYEASGIDLSHSYVEFGRDKGLDLYCCSTKEFSERGEQFDIVVLNHVLEHFTDLERELTIISRILKTEGFLFIGVPGVRALMYGTYNSDFLLLLQNAHIFNFTRTTLIDVMHRHGFENVFCNEMIAGVFKKSTGTHRYINEYEQTLKFLNLLEKNPNNTCGLVQERAEYILSHFEEGQVILYGTASELEMLISNTKDLSCIKGFFYTDKKKPEEVSDYIKSVGQGLKCLLIADMEKDNEITDEILDFLNDFSIEIYSAYRELV